MHAERTPYHRRFILLCAICPHICACQLHGPCSPDSAYSRHPWNLSVMPRQGGRYSSLLRVLDGNIAGEQHCCV